jgi:hypothetical protein
MIHGEDVLSIQRLVGQLVKLMLAFASTVISDFRLLEIHEQDFYSLCQVSAVMIFATFQSTRKLPS